MGKKTTDETTPDEVPALPEITELEIIAKMQAGLTRGQAVEVITNQRAHDKALAVQS